MKKDEFCLNSRRWIKLMAYKGQPPKSCPRRSDNFMTCQDCGYYQLREKSNYLKKVDNILKDYE